MAESARRRFGPARRFAYDGWSTDGQRGVLACHYRLDELRFTERFVLPGPVEWESPGVAEAARLLYLLAGVSYYKAGAPPVIDLAGTPVRPGEREMLGEYYREGLGEFAYRNRLDLSELEVCGGEEAGAPAHHHARVGHPLVPFGGGIDSIVTAETVRTRFPQTTLFVMSRQGDRYAALEAAAAPSGLPVARVERALDPVVVDSARRGLLNGHVPVTAVVSAAALLAAVVGGHDAVVMSNEWSASIGTTVEDGRQVNHQWSKGLAFETALRAWLARSFSEPPEYFSLLRPYSELWVAERFAALDAYHPVFRSCNRAFHVDPAARLERWCGRCDKCCFIDLVLAPFLPRRRLLEVFDGAEPLEDPSLAGRFANLVGAGEAKPFECVGDAGECAAAAAAAAARPDRAGNPLLPRLGAGAPPLERFLHRLGPDHIPPAYAPDAALR